MVRGVMGGMNRLGENLQVRRSCRECRHQTSVVTTVVVQKRGMGIVLDVDETMEMASNSTAPDKYIPGAWSTCGITFHPGGGRSNRLTKGVRLRLLLVCLLVGPRHTSTAPNCPVLLFSPCTSMFTQHTIHYDRGCTEWFPCIHMPAAAGTALGS